LVAVEAVVDGLINVELTNINKICVNQRNLGETIWLRESDVYRNSIQKNNTILKVPSLNDLHILSLSNLKTILNIL
jgi:hypothetical protein